MLGQVTLIYISVKWLDHMPQPFHGGLGRTIIIIKHYIVSGNNISDITLLLYKIMEKQIRLNIFVLRIEQADL